MEDVKDSLIDLERHRRRLEENINELQQALQHWRTWDLEYEALKEEVDGAPDSAPAELDRIREEFEGELVNRKEVDEIFGQSGQRSKDQIINVLDRRIDYVTKSIESLQKQLDTAENKHAAASVISQPDAQDEEGQPITEIVEELDEEDNVVSYRLNQPGQSMPHIREALQKAGVNELPTTEGESSGSSRVTELPSAQKQPLEPKPEPSRPTQNTASPTVKKEDAPPKKPVKKGVSFAEDTKPAADPEPEPTMEPTKSWNARRVENIMKTAKDQQDMARQDPVIPDNEDEDDAALRQDMLRYGMGEMGAVVAELSLEEGRSDEDDEEWDSDEGFDEDEDDDDEDKYGRYTGRTVTDQYRMRMLELEKKLGIKSRFTDGIEANPDSDGESDSENERMGRIVVNHKAQASTSASSSQPAKPATREKKTNGGTERKGVRFADSLDIAPDSPPKPAPTPVQKPEPVVEPMSEVVMERSGPSKTTEAKSSGKPSRFKKARKETSQQGDLPKGPFDVPARFVEESAQEVPTGPEGKTLADTLVEHESTSRPVDHDVDDFADHGSLADEHQRLRKKFIQRQGGFLKEDESPIQVAEEDAEAPPPLSRFKAARLSKQ